MDRAGTGSILLCHLAGKITFHFNRILDPVCSTDGVLFTRRVDMRRGVMTLRGNSVVNIYINTKTKIL
jgi:hypothetical protein